MKIFLLFLLFGIIACSSGIEQKLEKPVIIGNFSWNEWKNHAKWKSYSADNYFIPNEKIELIRSFLDLQNEKFLIFSGSWCGDSESELPKIIKIFDSLGISSVNYNLYGVDREKREPEGIAEQYKIEKVPTLIVLRNGTEIGRIIEFPQNTWEDDIFLIISKK